MTVAPLRIHVNVGSYDEAPEALIAEAVLHTVGGEGRAEGEISVTLLGDDGIREMNREYLGKDMPTDVISFSLGEGDALLGDVYIGMDQAERQAQELDVSFPEEVVRLAIHGALHVLGHDHPEGPEREASPMYALQEAYLAQVLPTSDAAAGDGA